MRKNYSTIMAAGDTGLWHATVAAIVAILNFPSLGGFVEIFSVRYNVAVFMA